MDLTPYSVYTSSSLLRLVTPVQLLLEHNAVHARLEQRKYQRRLALEVAQAVENLGRRLGCHGVEDRSELVEHAQEEGQLEIPSLKCK